MPNILDLVNVLVLEPGIAKVGDEVIILDPSHIHFGIVGAVNLHRKLRPENVSVDELVDTNIQITRAFRETGGVYDILHVMYKVDSISMKTTSVLVGGNGRVPETNLLLIDSKKQWQNLVLIN